MPLPPSAPNGQTHDRHSTRPAARATMGPGAGGWGPFDPPEPRILTTPLHQAAVRPARGGNARKRANLDLLSAGPLQRLAGVSATSGALALLIIIWIGRAELPELLAPRATLLLVCMALSLAVLLTAGFVLLVVAPTLNRPAAELAEVAEAVAAGDLTVSMSDTSGAGQMNRVWRAVGRMLGSLRRLAGALHLAAGESAVQAGKIRTAALQMAARSQETAHTSLALSAESASMAETIDAITAEAIRVTDIAADVAMGAQEGVIRNEQLRAVASSTRAQLDASARALDQLGGEIRENADAAGALTEASEEIRNFVALVRRMAKQSKLLSLNAAMEAARAGHEGDGFAVVATEVRRLALDSNEAARRTERAVAAILARVEASHALADRSVSTVEAVLAANSASEQAYAAVEDAAGAVEEWTRSIEAAANETSRRVNGMSERLDELARGTQAFAGAVQEVAASSERQSATTQEVAAAAAELTDASARLDGLVSTFRL